MPKNVISVEHLTKKYDLGVIGTGSLTRDINRWWARVRKQPDPYTRIGQKDAFASAGESILALDDISFTVEQGETLGIIGRNGAGKSTLLKILSRVTAPTSGVVKVKGRIGSLLEVGTGFHPELTGRENVYLNGAILGMKKAEVARKFDEIVAFSGVEKFIDTPVKRYSSGMHVRLGFAVAAHLDPEILIVDEVLAVGDAEFQKKCLGKMGEVAGEGRTVLFVSHNMASVEQLCERGLVISQGKIIVDSTSTLAVDYYYSTIRQKGKEIDPQSLAIYENNYIDKTKDVQLVRVEMLDKDNCPIVNLRTWDKLILIIQYWAKTEIRNGSVEIQISDSLGTKLLRFSTQPDSNIPLTIKKGYSQISCEIDKFPLAAGNYWIGCGLAIPNKKWLWFDEKLVMITVQPRDVFKSGLAPNNKRALFVIPHRWTIG